VTTRRCGTSQILPHSEENPGKLACSEASERDDFDAGECLGYFFQGVFFGAFTGLKSLPL